MCREGEGIVLVSDVDQQWWMFVYESALFKGEIVVSWREFFGESVFVGEGGGLC